MAITKEDILKALSYVEEPDLGKDLVTLNMIENVEVNGKDVSGFVLARSELCSLSELSNPLILF